MLWPPEVEGAKGGYARPRLVEPQQGVVRTLADVLRHAAERRDTRRRRPTLPDAQAFQSQCRGQRFPGLRFGPRDGSHELHDRRALAAEVREIDPQGAEEAGPAGFGAFQLVVPVVGAGEEAVRRTGRGTRHLRALRRSTRSRWAASHPSPRPARQTFAGDPRPSPRHGTPCPGRKFIFTATGFPSRSSNAVGTNQDEIPGPVAMACQTSSGVPGTSTSTWD